MDFKKYSPLVCEWIQTVLDHVQNNAELTMRCCSDIIEYGKQAGDESLVGFGYFYYAQIYYSLNDGDHFFDAVGNAMGHLLTAGEWGFVAQCYNFLGITAMNRGNAPIALDYYLNGVNHCRKYGLPEVEAVLNINIGALDVTCGRYEQAQEFLERAFAYVDKDKENPARISLLMCIYCNLGKCLIAQGRVKMIADIQAKVGDEDFWSRTDDLDKLSFYMMETSYYHQVGNYLMRDEKIALVKELMPENMTILDMFDDFYDYMLILLAADKDEEFWTMIEILEPMVRKFNILNLQTRIISLKMKCYRKHQRNADYLRAAGLYYELHELMERETQGMVGSLMNIRRSLEIANEEKQEMLQENAALHAKSETDALTGIANRGKLNEYSERLLDRAVEKAYPLAVEILDIDYFKEFNDNYGHQAGDGCLVQVSEAIRAVAARHGGFCARYGGDEFVIIYEDISYEDAFSYEKELKEEILARNIEHQYSKAIPQVTISQGMSWGLPTKGSRVWDYLHMADILLYRVKRITRNNYCLNRLEGTDESIRIGE